MTATDDRSIARSQGAPVLLACEPDHVYAVLHTPSGSGLRDTAVLIVPPFGWLDVCSYRARREWALRLAGAGYPAARIDLPGTGDSGGAPGSPGRVPAWIEAISASAAWLRESSGSRRVAALGIASGGLLAYAATSAGAPIDDLILWAVPAQGRRVVRELQVHAGAVKAMSRERQHEPSREGAAPADGSLELAGYALTLETKAALEAINLDELELDRARDRRVLLLGNDQRGVDARLSQQLERLGARTTIADSDDYHVLMSHPQAGRIPESTIARSVQWLSHCNSAHPSASGESQVPAVRSSRSVSFAHRGHTMVESVLDLSGESGPLTAILTEPDERDRPGLAAVFLNAGALRHTGPNRLWVECARAWAARGVSAVRVDLEGLGDSGGDGSAYARAGNLYAPELLAQSLAVLDQLHAAGIAERFIPVGLCSGAHMALHATFRDHRVVGALLLNLYAYTWNERLVHERDRRLTADLMRGGVIQRLREHGLPRHELVRAIRAFRPTLHRASEEAKQSRAMMAALDELRDENRARLLMLFSQGEAMYTQLELTGQLAQRDRWPNLVVEEIPSHDHELRALWLQGYLRDRLDRAIDELFADLPAR